MSRHEELKYIDDVDVLASELWDKICKEREKAVERLNVRNRRGGERVKPDMHKVECRRRLEDMREAELLGIDLDQLIH